MLFNIKNILKNFFLLTAIVGSLNASVLENESVIVGFYQNPGKVEKALIEKNGGIIRHTYSLLPAVAIEISKQGLNNLRDNSLVKYIEVDKVVKSINPNPLVKKSRQFVAKSIVLDDEYQNNWGIEHINSKKVHDKNITGAGVKIAILDSGIDYTHKDLKANYRGGYNFIKNDNNSSDPFDDGWNSHGTHIAGIIAAQADGSGVVGVAPDASIYAVKVLDSGGFGSVSDIIAGIQWSVENGMDIANISISGADSTILKDACDAAEKAGLLIIAAAGNSYGEDAAYPASYESVIAVSSINDTNELSYFSPVDGVVEIAAPGFNIQSTSRDNKYTNLSGTSQSVAFVSGVAALIISSGISDVNEDGEVNNLDVREKLQVSTLDLGKIGRDDQFGYGLVDADNATFVPVHSGCEYTYEQGWDESYESGFEEGNSDRCSNKTWNIDADLNYNTNFEQGYTDGYVKAYDDGWESGCVNYNNNNNLNYEDGFKAAYNAGFEEGNSDSCSYKIWNIDVELSYENKYNGDYDEGYADGYVKAYDDGWESCNK